MCYKDPSSQITAEDRLESWNENSEGEGEDEDEEMKERRMSHEQASPSAAAVKLSTSISLMNPQAKLFQKDKKVVTKKFGGSTTAIPASLSSFDPAVAHAMVTLGHTEPTPIQEQCWPICCDGKDVMGVAQTGSGKTLAYLLPALAKLRKRQGEIAQPDQDKEDKDVVYGPKVLVLVPTRELAIQVASQSRQLRSVSGLNTACLYGGVPKETQVELLQRNPQIVVATLGRLLDLVDDGLLSLSLVEYLVLDEADKMLGLGFKAQLDRLEAMILPKGDPLALLSKSKAKKKTEKANGSERKRPQVLLFTATMPESVDEAARQWLHQPVTVSVSHSSDSISKTITQVVHVCAEHKKPAKLLKHLQSIKESGANLRNPSRVLVFCNRIKTVRFLSDLVSKEGHRCAMLHGQRSQQEREEAVGSFKAGKVQVLLATDVAARGLDIRGLPYVVSYDFPSNLETYIHRVGRTGRLSASGHSFSFFTRNLAKLAGPLMTLLSEHGQSIDPNLQQLALAFEEAVKKAGGMEMLVGVEEGVEGGKEEEEEEEIDGRVIEAADIDEGLNGVVVKRVKAKEASVEQKGEAKAKAPLSAPSLLRPQPTAPALIEDPFIPSSKFGGSKKGYIFQTGLSGLGYYIDERGGLLKSVSKLNEKAVDRSTAPIIGGKKRKEWDEDSDDDFVSPLAKERKGSLSGRLRKKLKTKR